MKKNRLFAIYEKSLRYVCEGGLIRKGDLVTAGISGGADSMVMLDLLCRMQEQIGFTLAAVHVHHGIRGSEADRDAAYVKEQCSLRDVPCETIRCDVPELAKEWHMGEEETGRIMRRRILAAQARSIAAGSPEPADRGGAFTRLRIALAHNRDDQAETLLHHLCRGSSLRGMTGIRPVSPLSQEGPDRDLCLIRPVMCLSREEIEEYAALAGMDYMTDSTNLTDLYTRNRIRRLLPVLAEQVHPCAPSHIAAAAANFALAEDYLAAEGEKALVRSLISPPDTDPQTGAPLRFRIAEHLAEEPGILQLYALRLALERVSRTGKDLGTVHLEQLRDLLTGAAGRHLQLPCKVHAYRTAEGVEICSSMYPGDGTDSFAPTQKQMPQTAEWKYLQIPGVTDTVFGTFICRIFPYNGQIIPEKTYTKWLDYDKIHGKLQVRTRCAGDWFALPHGGGRKSLRRFMIDQKIPAADRDRIGLVACGNEVHWIISGRLGAGAMISSDTGRVLEIRLEPAAAGTDTRGNE